MKTSIFKVCQSLSWTLIQKWCVSAVGWVGDEAQATETSRSGSVLHSDTIIIVRLLPSDTISPSLSFLIFEMGILFTLQNSVQDEGQFIKCV